ncbi:Excreted virulence factor EspC, type VII ESX diderm [Lentzea fradiae]|uniref:Excreted virulence factor EspC, type VII ESX diderm n=1 Tax=Lentzea fradiae TaxID=200378 RepID=A0A1G7L3V1_9PSEU|nr:type VII secretion target [Lentzea fradiae]SDF43679.1 Excreted virulence factor EspC, type VII ESX diderm [Lentzea fradiae]
MSGYEVLSGELVSHAGKVEALAGRLRTAADAANAVAMDNSAYGVVCQSFAMMLQPFEELGVRALRQAAEAVSETAVKVRDTAEQYESADAATAASMTGIERTM